MAAQELEDRGIQLEKHSMALGARKPALEAVDGGFAFHTAPPSAFRWHPVGMDPSRTIVAGGVADHEMLRVQEQLAADSDVDGSLLLVARNHPHLRRPGHNVNTQRHNFQGN